MTLCFLHKSTACHFFAESIDPFLKRRDPPNATFLMHSSVASTNRRYNRILSAWCLPLSTHHCKVIGYFLKSLNKGLKTVSGSANLSTG